MTLLTGLNKIKEQMDQKSSATETSKVKVPWLKVDDGQKVKIWFLQEIDPGSKYYNEKVGPSGVQLEHQNPKDWHRKAACSLEDEGNCYGCEQYELGGEGYKGWRQKPRYFSNVLVQKNPDADPYVAVISQGSGDSAITDYIMEFAGDNGGITWLPWMLKRDGVGTDTSWTITPIINPELKAPDPTQYDLFDLESCVYKVPYEKQEEFYTATNSSSTGSSSQSEPEAKKPSHDETW